MSNPNGRRVSLSETTSIGNVKLSGESQSKVTLTDTGKPVTLTTFRPFSAKLSELSDVDVTQSTNGAVIIYDSESNSFELNDVIISDGQKLIFDAPVDINGNSIKLTANNLTDSIDTGVYALYVDGSANNFSGFFRDASDGGKFKFYKGLTSEPSSEINTSDPSYSMGEVVAVIDGGEY